MRRPLTGMAPGRDSIQTNQPLSVKFTLQTKACPPGLPHDGQNRGKNIELRIPCGRIETFAQLSSLSRPNTQYSVLLVATQIIPISRVSLSQTRSLIKHKGFSKSWTMFRLFVSLLWASFHCWAMRSSDHSQNCRLHAQPSPFPSTCFLLTFGTGD